MRGIVALLLVLLVVVACSEPTTTVSPPPPPATSPTSTVATVPPTTVATDPVRACPEGDVMLADGQLLRFDRPTSDGTRITGVSWRTSGNCQLVSVSFATADGAPATTPPTVTARLLRAAGVLRIETAATEAVVVDQLVEEGQVERLFVPADQEGFRFVDLVLNGPTVARARVQTSPARLEVELEPGGPAEIGSPLITPQLVIVEPGSAAAMEPVLDVSGYSTGELEGLQIAVLDQGETVAESPLDLETSPFLWRAFDFVLPMGDSAYDNLRLLDESGSVIAGIPFSP
ncbi:MAG TPA: hypothetical protein VLB85_05660 [Acidimicrobiia bacterium]|nr:hypothetical protein [Acidimicrobiia bacterium]